MKIMSHFLCSIILTLCSAVIVTMNNNPTIQILCNDNELVTVNNELIPWLMVLDDLKKSMGEGILRSEPIPMAFEKNTLETIFTCLSNIKKYLSTRNELLKASNKPLLSANLGNHYIPEEIEGMVMATLSLATQTDNSPKEYLLIALISATHFLEAPSFLMNVYTKLWVEKKIKHDYYITRETIKNDAENASIPFSIIDNYIAKHWIFRKAIIFKEINVADCIALDKIRFQIDFGRPTIYLQNKRLTSLDGIDELQNCNTLQRLFLHENNLFTICANHFLPFIQLKELDLSKNYLTNIDFTIFQHLAQLEYLTVKKNNITVIDPTPLQQLNRLRYFIFDKYKLTKENNEIITNMLPNVKTNW